MLIEIRCYFTCDRCGEKFSAVLEPPLQPPAGWQMFEMALHAVAEGRGYDGPKHPEAIEWGGPSVEEGDHLCSACTFLADMRAETAAMARGETWDHNGHD